MSQYEKLLKKFLEQRDLNVFDIIKILEKEGFTRAGGVGSHNLYKKGIYEINFPIHNGDCKKYIKIKL